MGRYGVYYIFRVCTCIHACLAVLIYMCQLDPGEAMVGNTMQHIKILFPHTTPLHAVYKVHRLQFSNSYMYNGHTVMYTYTY